LRPFYTGLSPVLVLYRGAQRSHKKDRAGPYGCVQQHENNFFAHIHYSVALRRCSAGRHFVLAAAQTRLPWYSKL
jgi:hypothetical protein